MNKRFVINNKKTLTLIIYYSNPIFNTNILSMLFYINVFLLNKYCYFRYENTFALENTFLIFIHFDQDENICLKFDITVLTCSILNFHLFSECNFTLQIKQC